MIVRPAGVDLPSHWHVLAKKREHEEITHAITRAFSNKLSLPVKQKLKPPPGTPVGLLLLSEIVKKLRPNAEKRPPDWDNLWSVSGGRNSCRIIVQHRLIAA
jgi:hypothetical protein